MGSHVYSFGQWTHKCYLWQKTGPLWAPLSRDLLLQQSNAENTLHAVRGPVPVLALQLTTCKALRDSPCSFVCDVSLLGKNKWLGTIKSFYVCNIPYVKILKIKNFKCLYPVKRLFFSGTVNSNFTAAVNREFITSRSKKAERRVISEWIYSVAPSCFHGSKFRLLSTLSSLASSSQDSCTNSKQHNAHCCPEKKRHSFLFHLTHFLRKRKLFSRKTIPRVTV